MSMSQIWNNNLVFFSLAYQMQMEPGVLDGASETIQSKIQGVILTPLFSHSSSRPLGSTFVIYEHVTTSNPFYCLG